MASNKIAATRKWVAAQMLLLLGDQPGVDAKTDFLIVLGRAWM